ncbi:MAG TPA: mechanosensitive ion channel domain-containing protein, partial [Rhodocyclaceae bacterium]|nr:mechanosensitive ion channel domain-containing protein [Rhodocyclaceae bacterium]
MQGLFDSFLNLWAQPTMRYQLLLIVALIALAIFLARDLRQHTQARFELRNAGLRRLAFPLLSILLLMIARFAAHHFGWSLDMAGIAIQLLLALAGVRIVVFALRRAFAPSAWLGSFEKTIVILIWAGMALDLLGVLPELIDWLDSFSLHIGKGHVTLWSIMQGVTIVLTTLIAALWLGGLFEARVMEAPTLDSSLKVVLSRAVKAVMIVLAVLIGMSLSGLDVTTLSVFGGALGVGLGLGMQKIASNYVSGFIILLDRSIQIGNLIQVAPEQRGEVTQITTRYTVLRALNGNHYIVPNEVLVNSVVQNETFADPRVRTALQLQVAYDTDIERAIGIMEELAKREPRVVADPPPRAFLISFDDNGIRLELSVWIADPLKGTTEVRSNIARALLKRFRQEGIQIPYPQHEVRIVGSAPT